VKDCRTWKCHLFCFDSFSVALQSSTVGIKLDASGVSCFVIILAHPLCPDFFLKIDMQMSVSLSIADEYS
jgi:hypothetical protein